MSRVRTVFLGTPDFARYCLEGLIRDEHFEVVGVLTQPDRPAGRHMHLTPSLVKQLVAPLGIPVLTPEKASDPAVLADVAAWRAEVAVVVAYGQILKQDFLDLFPKKIVNVHASLLPRWRGAAPIQRALMEGDKESGVCLQVMEKKLDAGGILGRRVLDLGNELNALEILEQMKPLARELLSVDLMDYLRGNLSPLAQDETQVTYAHKIEKSESPIKWDWSNTQVMGHVRGMAMGPGATCQYKGTRLKLHRVRCVEATGKPGEVVRVEQKSFTVACGKGAIEVLELQPESRSRMQAAEYLLGHKLQLNERLE